MKRPVSVPIIGCTYIGCGSVLVLGSLFLLVTSALFRLPNAGPDQNGLASNFFNNFTLGICVPLCPAAILIFAGAAFLMRWPWSRPMLETLAWLGLILLIGSTLIGLNPMTSLLATGPGVPSGSVPGGLPTFAYTALALGVDFALGLPLIVIIFVLRSRAVRDAMVRQQV